MEHLLFYLHISCTFLGSLVLLRGEILLFWPSLFKPFINVSLSMRFIHHQQYSLQVYILLTSFINLHPQLTPDKRKQIKRVLRYHYIYIQLWNIDNHETIHKPLSFVEKDKFYIKKKKKKKKKKKIIIIISTCDRKSVS